MCGLHRLPDSPPWDNKDNSIQFKHLAANTVTSCSHMHI